MLKLNQIRAVATFLGSLRAYDIRSSLYKFPREYSDYMYYYGASAFFIGLSFAWLGSVSAKNPEKRALAKVLLLVDGVAMATYLIQASRLTPSLKDMNGYPVDLARYLEWICTCPSLVSLIANVTRNPGSAAKTVFSDYVLLVCGFLGAIFREPYSQMCFFIAVGSFFNVISGLWDMFTNAIEGNNDCKLDKLSLSLARGATIVAWTAFPLTYFSVRYRLIDYAVGETCFVIADVLAKVFLTLILINATVEESQNQKVDALSNIANEMETEMGNTEKLLERLMPAEYVFCKNDCS